MNKKPMDYALSVIDEEIKRKEAKAKKMKPFLDKEVRKVEKIDNEIVTYERKIKLLEEKKQEALTKVDSLLDLAMVDSHTLPNGYQVRPDNKRKVEVTNVAEFMGYLKREKSAGEVFSFFANALKLSNLKRFCEDEANLQRQKGIMVPKVDGVNFGEVTYNRLTTTVKRRKK